MKSWKIGLLALSAGLMVGCSSSSPKETVKNFAENLAKHKFDEAKKYCTERTVETFSLYRNFGELDPNYKFEFIKDSIEGNEAWVTYVDISLDTAKIHVVKIDDEWLVDEPMIK